MSAAIERLDALTVLYLALIKRDLGTAHLPATPTEAMQASDTAVSLLRMMSMSTEEMRAAAAELVRRGVAS